MSDHTIQFKVFRKDEDEPSYWLEFREVPTKQFNQMIAELSSTQEPMNRTGD